MGTGNLRGTAEMTSGRDMDFEKIVSLFRDSLFGNGDVRHFAAGYRDGIAGRSSNGLAKICVK